VRAEIDHLRIQFSQGALEGMTENELTLGSSEDYKRALELSRFLALFKEFRAKTHHNKIKIEQQ
jgi:hypothetical protein